MIINGVSVPIAALAEEVYCFGQYLKENFAESDLRDEPDATAGGDFRLQVNAGTWRTWQGDPQYDTDHRGAWASAFVPRGCTRNESSAIARELLEECE
jgi:hypothetical protein